MTRAQAIEAGAMSDDDTRTIAQLRRQLHDIRNQLTSAQGALPMIANALGMPLDSTIEAVILRIQELI